MKKLILAVALIIGLFANLSYSQKKVFVEKTSEKIKIDGFEKEKVWERAKKYSGFVQIEPSEGKPATEKTIVMVAYDEKNIYVFAKLYDSSPEKIMKRVAQRDSYPESDWFIVAIDPYHDKRSGFIFGVNPSNSIFDAVLFNDSGRDFSWDGVWESAVKIGTDGWSVEIKIPFNQLNFKDGEKEHVWGINFERIIKRKNEKDSFVYIKRNDKGYVSHFAELRGLKDIKTGIYAELMPYFVMQETLTPDDGNPEASDNQFSYNSGVDLKINLKSNLKLNLTINPDFGQVEVDPAVMNLTAYETYYEEKRPFFVEGASIFDFGRGGIQFNININWTVPEFFYSRRIGKAPSWLPLEGEVKNYPTRTTILGALKLTGKIFEDTNIGILGAVTSREYADLIVDGENLSKEVEPLSFYGVFRIQKEINQGESGIGLIGTGVVRGFDDDYLRDFMNDKSFSLGIDGWKFFGKEKKWVLSGWLGGSFVSGTPDRIYSLQLSPEHYFQRPDADYLELDPARTSLSGWAGRITLNKEKGNWLFFSSVGAISPGFDVQELGFQREGDIINGHAFLGYQSYEEGKIFRFYLVAGGVSRNYDFGGDRLSNIAFGMFEGLFKNYWRLHIEGGYFGRGYSKTETRGGPLMVEPEGEFIGIHVYSDSRKKVMGGIESNMMLSSERGNRYTVWSYIKFKPTSNFTFSIGPEYVTGTNNSQWVSNIDDELMEETLGKRYIFAKLDQKVLSARIRLNWNFSSNIGLTLFLQPFIAVGDYSEFKELKAPRTYDFNVYGTNGSIIEDMGGYYRVDPDGEGPASQFYLPNPDFNYKSIRGTMVLRWEFKRGSNLYFVWTQEREDFSPTGVLSFKDDFMDMIKAPGTHIFLVKVSYRWGLN